MATHSPVRRAQHNCLRLLRSSTVSQRHATAQHILNKQLPDELKNEVGLEAMQDAGPSGQSIKATQSRSQTAARNGPVHRKLNFHSFGKNKGPKTGRKLPADQRQTHKKNVSSTTSSASLKHGSSMNRTA